MLLFFLFLLFVDGVSGAETDETVMEGDSVTLHTDITEIQNDDTILWLFGPRDSVISQIARKADLTSFFVTDDAGFRGRLQVDQKTGSLTIRNTRIRHSGRYKLTVSREKTTTKIFNVTVFAMAGGADGVKSESVMEGKSVTLQNNVEVQRDDLIVWRFGDKGILLAKIDLETKEISLNDADERFRDRLQLNQNGSLIIKKTKTEHTGLYELQIRGRESDQRFLLSVTAVAGPHLSPGVLAGIVVAALLVAAVLVSVVIYYRRKISKLKKYMDAETAYEGESFTLHTGLNKLHNDDEIQWYYQEDKNDNLLAHSQGKSNNNFLEGADGRFRDKLKWGENGDLIITDIRTIHSGLYILKINGKRRNKRKKITVSVEDAETAYEGESFTLHTGLNKLHNDDEIQWYYQEEKNENLIAIKRKSNNNLQEGADGRFRGKLKWGENGDLTITDIRTIHSGLYILKTKNKCKKITVSVEVNEIQVKEGGCDDLKADAEIQGDDLLLWMFGAEKSLVATNATWPIKTDERFAGRVEKDNGCLTINNIRTEDKGHYKLQIINSKQTTCRRFNVTDPVTANEGESFTLHTGLNKLHNDDEIQWYYQEEKNENRIAIKGKSNNKFQEGADGRFRGKLKWGENGDLTITDIRTIHSGLYILKINGKRRNKCKKITVSVDPTESQGNESEEQDGKNKPEDTN
ncbi:uncharacterized protein LOC127508115 isoform X1 [Ctenopharyngodon idella]|uniref:uncharacterized protein LOC127508115 isoform X1 n=1 Tax=Ctenopharyngodon idella TaxID=7959 RepID=UPI00222FB433|nr:uncharacterized protein LOC127508115 isoform X1 [Ctenopharyngodon idella]